MKTPEKTPRELAEEIVGKNAYPKEVVDAFAQAIEAERTAWSLKLVGVQANLDAAMQDLERSEKQERAGRDFRVKLDGLIFGKAFISHDAILDGRGPVFRQNYNEWLRGEAQDPTRTLESEGREREAFTEAELEKKAREIAAKVSTTYKNGEKVEGSERPVTDPDMFDAAMEMGRWATRQGHLSEANAEPNAKLLDEVELEKVAFDRYCTNFFTQEGFKEGARWAFRKMNGDKP